MRFAACYSANHSTWVCFGGYRLPPARRLLSLLNSSSWTRTMSRGFTRALPVSYRIFESDVGSRVPQFQQTLHCDQQNRRMQDYLSRWRREELHLCFAHLPRQFLTARRLLHASYFKEEIRVCFHIMNSSS